MMQAEGLGMRAFGLEPSVSGFQICKFRGLNVTNSFLEDSGYAEDSFDVITLNHVLEHVPDPYSSLLLIGRLLRPSGILIIQVPNLKSLAFYASREYFSHLDVPRHLFQFEKSTLEGFLNRAGLRVIRIRYYTYATSLLASLWLRSRGNVPVSTRCASVSKRNKLVFALVELVFTPFELLLNTLGLGDVIEVYASRT